MSFSHADFARALDATIHITEKEMDWQVRHNKMHPMHAREHIAALKRLREREKALANQERAERVAESRMEDVEATSNQRLEASHVR